MSEVSQEGGGGKHKGGKPQAKKASTHIDMTPMVDLAFLLLTFFMLTTSFSKPKTMEIVMPDKPKPGAEPPKINQRDVMNLLLAEDNRLFYYFGIDNPEVKQTNYSPNGIRKLLLEYVKNPKFMVLIKPDEHSKYKNVVDIFDEMNITGVQRYALVPITPQEKDMIKKAVANAQ